MGNGFTQDQNVGLAISFLVCCVMKYDFEDALDAFMSIHWLRPENGFWTALRSKVLNKINFEGRVIDISCGDGLFSFLHNGGRLARDFDMFRSVGHLGEVRDKHKDMFDSDIAEYEPKVITRPALRYSAGTDWKQSLLSKAGTLDFYERLTLHDNDDALPFEKESFDIVYSNSIYWVKNIENHIKDLKRICKTGGKLVLEIKTNNIRDYTIEARYPQFGMEFHSLLNRGRFSTWKTFRGLDWWRAEFKKMGMIELDCEGFIAPEHAFVWDVGLRPIAPSLVMLANNVSEDIRNRAKEEMIETFKILARPLCEIPVKQESAVEYLIVLEK